MSKRLEESDMGSLMLANMVGHYWFRAGEVVIGRNGLQAVINLANQSHYNDDKPPPDEKLEFPAADLTALNLAFMEFGGRILGSGLAKRAGQAWITEMVRHDALQLLRDLEIPTPELLEMILETLTVFGDRSMLRLERLDETIVCTLENCPTCWGILPDMVPLRKGRPDPAPICHFIVGVLSEGIRIACGRREFAVTETQCHAQGAAHCAFAINTHPHAEI